MNEISFDTEMNLGNNDLILIDENIIYAKIVGKHDINSGRKIINTILGFIEKLDGKINVLADLSEIGMPSYEVRNLVNDAFETGKLGKIAFFGGNPVVKVIAIFIMGNSKKLDIRYFNSKEKAHAWLRG